MVTSFMSATWLSFCLIHICKISKSKRFTLPVFFFCLAETQKHPDRIIELLLHFMCTCYFKHVTFSWISCVDWASQNATVATSFRMGISTVQSRPSSSATRGRGCMGPFIMGGLMPKNARSEGQRVRSAEQKKKRRQGRHGWKSRLWCWNTTSVNLLQKEWGYLFCTSFKLPAFTFV